MTDPDITPDAIRSVRATLKLSQADLATALGVQVLTVSRWETGRFQPSGEVRERLARLIREASTLDANLVAHHAEAVAADPDGPEVAEAGAAAIERGLAAGIGLLAAWLLGWAARSHALGESPVTFLAQRVREARMSDEPARQRSRDDAAIHAIQQAGLWPWDGPH